jgi:hypothetical protein
MAMHAADLVRLPLSAAPAVFLRLHFALIAAKHAQHADNK